MNVYKIGHASLIVEARGARCLMDPVFFEPFECGVNCFEPPIRIDPNGVQGAYNLVVISHEHGDHFCIRSLNLLERRCPVVFPRGCGLIARALEAMGFQELWPVTPGQIMGFNDLELTFTPSNVVFPEMGVLFSHAGRHVWNCVDTEFDQRAFSLVRQRAGRLDLMFAQYQALIEEELGCDALGGSFPYKRYAMNLNAVTEANPRCVVPSSCGYRYCAQPWQNQRGFPISERQFLEDVRTLLPGTQALSLPQGGVINAEDFVIRENALPWVERIDEAPAASLDWRPDLGVPSLQDEDPYEHGAEALRREVGAFLKGEFLRELMSPSVREWRERLAAAGVVWQLEVVYPNGEIEESWLDFAQPSSAWLTGAPRTPKIITSICASTLVGLRSGEVTPYRALFTRRVVLKLYALSPGGLRRIGALADEPIGRLLFPTANLRHVDAELKRLGYKPTTRFV
ncbi:MAG: hypothetical protein ABW208_18750 [Pyrinomonadaceae bacterium]